MMLRGVARNARQVNRMAPTLTQTRGMATEKELKRRIGSVTNIEKITKAMKMVAAAKLRGAQDSLDISRCFIRGIDGVWTMDAVPDEKASEGSKHLFVPMTADRGLCGAVNSAVVRHTRDAILKYPRGSDLSILIVGEKGKAGLERLFANSIVGSINELSKNNSPTFATMCSATDEMNSIDHDVSRIFSSKFVTLLSYDTINTTRYPYKVMKDNTTSLEPYEMEGEGDVLQNFHEFTAAVQLFGAVRENEVSELSSRMNAMGSSAKNAGEMLDNLRLLYNRTRQARITTELIEIISGAIALEDQD